MRIQNLTQQQNFRGFKNVLCSDVHNDSSRIAYITMQLDDEGVKDLSKWRELRNIMPQLKSDGLPEDVVSLIYVRANDADEFRINNKIFPRPEQLRDFDGFKNQFSAVNNEINFALKASTLFADITKRMQVNPLYKRDAGIQDVTKAVLKHFTTLFKDSEEAVTDFLILTMNRNVEGDRVAHSFNRMINYIMKQYLK